MRSRSLTLTLTGAALALGACGGDAPTAPAGATLAGTYTLQTFNGAATPAVIAQVGTQKEELLSGTFVLRDDQTFTQSATLRSTAGQGQTATETITCAGSYVQSGSAVTFTEPETSDGNCGGRHAGTWSAGTRLTVRLWELSDAVAVYAK